MVSLILLLATIITMVISDTFICDQPSCDFGICTNDCNDRTYICSSNSTVCSLDCQYCNNITFISSSQNTEISCTQNNSCNNMTIHISQTDTKSNNSLILTCFGSHSCSNINILCNNPNLCQCKGLNAINTQCNINTNNINGNYSIWISTIFNTNDTQTIHNKQHDIQIQNDSDKFIFGEQGTAVTLIIFVVLFWCLVCICVPIYIKRWRQTMLSKNPDEDLADLHFQPNDIIQNELNIAENINTSAIPAVDPTIENNNNNSKESTHRRVLSDSIMERIINNMDFDKKIDESDSDYNVMDDIKPDIIYETNNRQNVIQNAEVILKRMRTNNNNGEFQLTISPLSRQSNNSSISPNSAESMPSKILLYLPSKYDAKCDSNKAQSGSVVEQELSMDSLQLPKLETSMNTNNAATDASLDVSNFQISIMSPSNFSPTTGTQAVNQILNHLSSDLELLYTESEVNQKLNGDYID